MKPENGAWTAPSRVRAMNLADERCVERRGFTWAVQASHSGPHAGTIWYVRPLPSRSLGAPHPWPRVQPPRVAAHGMHRRRQRRLASRSLPVASRSDKRGTPLSNSGASRARWGLGGDPVLMATLSCPRLVARRVLIKINFGMRDISSDALRAPYTNLTELLVCFLRHERMFGCGSPASLARS
jgi:hypothetical protein